MKNKENIILILVAFVFVLHLWNTGSSLDLKVRVEALETALAARQVSDEQALKLLGEIERKLK